MPTADGGLDGQDLNMSSCSHTRAVYLLVFSLLSGRGSLSGNTGLLVQ